MERRACFDAKQDRVKSKQSCLSIIPHAPALFRNVSHAERSMIPVLLVRVGVHDNNLNA